jgi:TPR repeat protein
MAMTLTTTSVALFVNNAGPRPSVLAKGALQDHAKAFYWFSKAAKKGFAQGQLSLGLAYRYPSQSFYLIPPTSNAMSHPIH